MKYNVENITAGKGFRDFLDLPKRIYKNDANWIAPLNSEVRKVLNVDRNPYFSNVSLQKFVCYKSNIACARSVVIINKAYWEKWSKRTAWFGFFESVDDIDCARILFEEMERYCREEGAECLEGPYNPNHYSELGLLIKNYSDPPAFFETYNSLYYSRLIEEAGFKIIKQLHTRINKKTDEFVKRSSKSDTGFNGREGYSIRSFQLRNRKADLEKIREINNNAFSDNWSFLPLSKKEYLFTSKYLFLISRPGLVLIVEHKNKPVGVLLCVLNINKLLKTLHRRGGAWNYPKLFFDRRSLNEIVIHAIGIKKEYQNTCVFKLIYNEMCKIVQRYPVVSTTWITDDNIPAIRAAETLGLKPYKWFAVYGKTLK